MTYAHICVLWFKYGRDSTKTTVQDRYSKKGVNPSQYAQFYRLPLYVPFYIRSRCSSPHEGKTRALRTDSNGLSDPTNDKRSVENERVEEQWRSKFSSSWLSRFVLNFGVFASETISIGKNYIPGSMVGIHRKPCTVEQRRTLVFSFHCS